MVTVKELKAQAKEKGVPRYYNLRKTQLEHVLSGKIFYIKLKIPPTVDELKMKAKEKGVPRFYNLRKSVPKEALSDDVMFINKKKPPTLKKLIDIIKKRGVKGYYKMNRNRIEAIISKYDVNKKFKLREFKSALRGFLKTHRIDGDKDYDARLFLNKHK